MRRTIVSEKSEISIFNVIGEYVKSKNYIPFYFKRPMIKSINNSEEVTYEYLHFIHIKKDNKMIYSIYYDDKDLAGAMDTPYYELYDLCDTERFAGDLKEEDLFNRIKELI